MSSFPDILRPTKSAILKPFKQGGIFSLKIAATQACNTIQPQQYFSVAENKVAQSQILTNNSSTNHKHHRNLSLANFTRHVVSSQAQRRPPSRVVSSRLSARQTKKQHQGQGYGGEKLTSFAIAETTASNFQQAESLVHRVNELTKVVQKCEEQFFETVKVTFAAHSHILRLHDEIDQNMDKLKKQAQIQFEKLRKVLSGLRRTTLVGVKVNKKQIQDVSEQYRDIASILNTMDHRGYKLHKTVFN